MSEVVETSFSRRLDELYAEGFELGLEWGSYEAYEHIRKLLYRMAADRFDAEAAERLAVVIAAVDDPQCLEDIRVWIIDGKTADELIEHAGESTT